MEVSEVAKTVEVPQMWLQMSPFRLFGTTVGYSKLWYSPKQAHLLPCLRVVLLLVAHRQVASGLAEGEDFLQPDSWSLLGHVAPACLFLLNLFVLLIVSETEPLPGRGRIQGHSECDRATCSGTDHALLFWASVFQGLRSRMQGLVSRLFESWLFCKDSDSRLIRGIYRGAWVLWYNLQHVLTRNSHWGAT